MRSSTVFTQPNTKISHQCCCNREDRIEALQDSPDKEQLPDPCIHWEAREVISKWSEYWAQIILHNENGLEAGEVCDRGAKKKQRGNPLVQQENGFQTQNDRFQEKLRGHLKGSRKDTTDG